MTQAHIVAVEEDLAVLARDNGLEYPHVAGTLATNAQRTLCNRPTLSLGHTRLYCQMQHRQPFTARIQAPSKPAITHHSRPSGPLQTVPTRNGPVARLCLGSTNQSGRQAFPASHSAPKTNPALHSHCGGPLLYCFRLSGDNPERRTRKACPYASVPGMRRRYSVTSHRSMDPETSFSLWNIQLLPASGDVSDFYNWSEAVAAAVNTQRGIMCIAP